MVEAARRSGVLAMLGAQQRGSPTWKGGAFWEFFDLANDPLEMHNLYGDPSQGRNVTEMKRQLRVLVEQYQDTEAAKMIYELYRTRLAVTRS